MGNENNKREIAVVHGRDSEVNTAVFEFLRKLDLHPREWEEVISKSSEATPYTGDLIKELFKNVQAVVVIFTPDDETRLHPDLRSPDESLHETRFMCQPRPNVLFEAGRAFGLYPKRTVLVEAGELRPISDLIGRHTVRLNTENSIKSFVNRLEAAGCAINTKGSDWLKFSNFDSLKALDRKPKARVNISEEPNRILATNIWLNPWEVGQKETILSIADKENQKHPIIAKRLLRDLSRSNKQWSLYSKKDGPNAQLRIRGQVNIQAIGSSDLKLILVQQRFAIEGRPISNPPDAGPMGYSLIPGQESNIDFEISIPDREYREGSLLYGLHIIYKDENDEDRELEIFWWYDFEQDKFWNNLNKVPYFDSIRNNFW